MAGLEPLRVKIFETPATWQAALLGATDEFLFDYTRAYDTLIQSPAFLHFLEGMGQTALADAIRASPAFYIRADDFMAAYKCYVVHLTTYHLLEGLRNEAMWLTIGSVLYQRRRDAYESWGESVRNIRTAPLLELTPAYDYLNRLYQLLGRLIALLDWAARQKLNQCLRIYTVARTAGADLEWDYVNQSPQFQRCAFRGAGTSTSLELVSAEELARRNQLVALTLLLTNLWDRLHGYSFRYDLRIDPSYELGQIVAFLQKIPFEITPEAIGARLKRLITLIVEAVGKLECGQPPPDYLTQTYVQPGLLERSPGIGFPAEEIFTSSYLRYQPVSVPPESGFIPGGPDSYLQTRAFYPEGLQFVLFETSRDWGTALDQYNETTLFDYLRAYDAGAIGSAEFRDYISSKDPEAQNPGIRPGPIRSYYTPLSELIKGLKNYYTGLIQRGLALVLNSGLMMPKDLYKSLRNLFGTDDPNPYDLGVVCHAINPIYTSLQNLTLLRDWEQKLLQEECRQRYGMIQLGLEPEVDPRFQECDRIAHQAERLKTDHQKPVQEDLKHLKIRNLLAYYGASLSDLWSRVNHQHPAKINTSDLQMVYPGVPRRLLTRFYQGIRRPDPEILFETTKQLFRQLRNQFTLGGVGSHQVENPDRIDPNLIEALNRRSPFWGLSCPEPQLASRASKRGGPGEILGAPPPQRQRRLPRPVLNQIHPEISSRRLEASPRYFEASSRYPESSSRYPESSSRYSESSSRYPESSSRYPESSSRYSESSSRYPESSSRYSESSSRYPESSSRYSESSSRYPEASSRYSESSSRYSEASSRYPESSSRYSESSSRYPESSSRYPESSSRYPETSSRYSESSRPHHYPVSAHQVRISSSRARW